ncbi:hypothetical protein EV426DRAFT_668321, partial [Tirmania nivea]
SAPRVSFYTIITLELYEVLEHTGVHNLSCFERYSMSDHGSTSRGPPSQQLNSRMGVATNHLPARSNSMMRRAFPGPRRVSQLQGTAELQRTKSRKFQHSPGSAPTAPVIACGPTQQASPTYDSIRPAPNIPAASAPPNHGETPAICNWKHTAIDPRLGENILDPCLQTDCRRFSIDRSVMAEMFNLITGEETKPTPIEQKIPCGGEGRVGENKESPIYELVARGLSDETTYQEYLHSEMEKLVNKFEVEYHAYLHRQNHPSTIMTHSGVPSQQPEITPMAGSGKTSTGTLSGPALAVPTRESGKSYGSTEDSGLRLLAPEPEAPVNVFIDHNLRTGLEFDWNPPAMPPPPAPPPPSPSPPPLPPPPSMVQGFPNLSIGFEGYHPASGLAISSFRGPAHSHMSHHFQPGPTSFPMQIQQQNALQMNQMQYTQTPTCPDGMVMQAPRVSPNSTPHQVPLVPSFTRPSNLSLSPAPCQLQRRHTTGPSFRQRNMLKRSAPDS